MIIFHETIFKAQSYIIAIMIEKNAVNNIKFFEKQNLQFSLKSTIILIFLGSNIINIILNVQWTSDCRYHFHNIGSFFSSMYVKFVNEIN